MQTRSLTFTVATLSAFATSLLAAPKTAEQALADLRVADNLTVQLVASEPEIVDPVSARFDEQGRLWVVEMQDYPTGPADGAEPAGRVRLLTDSDGDGFYESATTFANNLLMPTGLQPWKDGAIVTLSGEVAYFFDKDHDGVAEGFETWFQGFDEGNEQLRANHPKLDPNGQITIACGLRGGEIRDVRRGKPSSITVSVNGRDFRFDPRGKSFEAITGHGQYGLTYDDFGRRFVCMNARPLDHVVLEADILNRNSNWTDSSSVEHVIPGGLSRPVFPLVQQWTTSVYHTGSFTAACGVHIHRGTALGNSFRGNAFVCEPTGCLVHREVLSDAGPSFTAEPGTEGVEFLASTDDWFRPVDLFDGPDGALYVVDMARKVIEHPQWMPKEAIERSDFVAGNRLGRIYRVAKKQHAARSTATAVQIAEMDQAELLETLRTTEIGWRRDEAFRALLQRSASLPPMAWTGSIDSGLTAELRLRGALGQLTVEDVGNALTSKRPRLQEVGCDLANTDFAGSSMLQPTLYRLAKSSDAKVRFRTAIALAGDDSVEALDALVAVAIASKDPWTRSAVFSSLAGQSLEFVERLATETSDSELIRMACEVAVREDEKNSVTSIQAMLAHDVSRDIQLSGLLGVAAALRSRPDDVSVSHHAASLTRLIKYAIERYRNGDVDAAAFLAWYLPDDADWTGLIYESVAPEARIELINVLRTRACLPDSNDFLQSLTALPAGVRESLLNAMCSSVPRAMRLLTSIQDGYLPPTILGSVRADQLRKHRNSDVSNLAKEVIPPRDSNRPVVVKSYAASLTLDCDAMTGEAVFKKHCAVCHRIGELGGQVGPDLSDLRKKTPAQLLEAILDPNSAIDANYINHVAETTNGQIVTGLLVSESESAVTLRGADARDTTIARDELESLTSTGQSIMPEGLERQLDQQAIANVVYYLKNWRYETGK